MLWLQECYLYLSGRNKVNFNDISDEWLFINNKDRSNFDEKMNLYKSLEKSKLNKTSFKKWIKEIFIDLDLTNVLSCSPYSNKVNDVKKIRHTSYEGGSLRKLYSCSIWIYQF